MHSGFNYGALFFCSMMLGVCCFLMSKCTTEKLFVTLELTKTVCSKLMDGVKILIDHTHRVNMTGAGRVGFDKLVMESDSDSDLSTKDKSGLRLLNKVCREQGIPGFKRNKYIKKLRDQSITLTEQFKQLNTSDWAGFGIPKNVVNIMQAKTGSMKQGPLSSGRSAASLSSVKYCVSWSM